MRDFILRRVHYVPAVLEPGALYVSEAFEVAVHLCACGCGAKVVTPLDATGWRFTEKVGQATLHPSIGNWQLPCRSHYWIRSGKVVWAEDWSEERVEAGRRAEAERARAWDASRPATSPQPEVVSSPERLPTSPPERPTLLSRLRGWVVGAFRWLRDRLWTR